MTTKKLLTLGMAMLFAFISTSCSDDNVPESAIDTKPWPYDANMDTTVSPGDDFFMYCNGTWWKNYDLNGNDYWGFCACETEEYIENYKKKMNSPALNRIKDDIRNIDNTTDAALAAIGKALQITEGIETNEDAWRAIGKALKMGYQPFFKFTLIPRSRVMKACLGKSDDSDDETGKLANPYSLRYLSTHPERLDDFVPLAKMKTRSTGYAMLDCIFSELGIPESDATIDEEVLDWYKQVQKLSPQEIKERIRKSIMRDICFASNKDFEENKSLYVTELGEAVNDIMVKAFPSIVDVNFTANMEALLDKVGEGLIPWKTIVRNFYPDLDEAVNEAQKELETVKIADEVTDEICELCGRNMVIKYGPHGKFLACPGFPECKNTKTYLEKIGVKCPECGRELVVRKTKKGRRYYGCEGYPECEYMTWQKPKAE